MKKKPMAELAQTNPTHYRTLQRLERERVQLGGLHPDDSPAPVVTEALMARIMKNGPRIAVVASKTGITERRLVHFQRGAQDLKVGDLDRFVAVYGARWLIDALSEASARE